MAITDVRQYQVSSQDPDIEFDKDRAEFKANTPETITQRRNREEGITTRLERFSELSDFYNENDKFEVTNKDRNKFQSFRGLISPLPLTLTFANGDTEGYMVPAEIWRRNSKKVTKLIVRDRQITSITLDAEHQTADADHRNNMFPSTIMQSRLEAYKSDYKATSMMADMLVELKGNEDEAKSDPEAKDNYVPLEEASGSSKAPTSSDTATQSPNDVASKPEEASQEAEEKKKSTLRRTLERMMGKE